MDISSSADTAANFAKRRGVWMTAVGIVVLLVAVWWLFGRGTTTVSVPLDTTLEFCKGSGIDVTPENAGEETWTGSGDKSQPNIRCVWDDVTVELAKTRLEQMGYTNFDVQTGVTDYLGRSDSWVINSSGSEQHEGLSVGGSKDGDLVDVIAGGFIHVHEDGTVHVHDVNGIEVTPDN